MKKRSKARRPTAAELRADLREEPTAPFVRHPAFTETRAPEARLHGEEIDAVREDALIGTSGRATANLQAEEPSDEVRVPR